MDRELTGRVALVTGVSRPIGIAAAVAKRLHESGATVYATGWSGHDAEMPWGVQPIGEMPFAVHEHDMADPTVPAAVIDDVITHHGRLDIVAAVHARSSSFALGELTAEELDLCWAVNVRSIILLAQRFAQVHDAPPRVERPTGRLVWFTSGQHLGPMDGELPYAVTKGALHQMTASIGRALAPTRIVANCINPGPVDTGYAKGAVREQIAEMFADGEWGTPQDIADIVAFLVSDAGAWIRGEVLNAEGGFHRFR